MLTHVSRAPVPRHLSPRVPAQFPGLIPGLMPSLIPGLTTGGNSG